MHGGGLSAGARRTGGGERVQQRASRTPARYEAVCTGGSTGHAEVVRLVYDPREVSTARLLEVFSLVHDPTTQSPRGTMSGTQCRSHFLDPSRAGAGIAKDLIAELDASGRYHAVPS